MIVVDCYRAVTCEGWLRSRWTIPLDCLPDRPIDQGNDDNNDDHDINVLGEREGQNIPACPRPSVAPPL